MNELVLNIMNDKQKLMLETLTIKLVAKYFVRMDYSILTDYHKCLDFVNNSVSHALIYYKMSVPYNVKLEHDVFVERIASEFATELMEDLKLFHATK
jgi:hypothetical protein